MLRILSGLLFSLLSLPLSANSLTPYLQRLYQQHPQLQAARAGLAAQQQKLPQAESLRKPQLDLVGQWTQQRTGSPESRRSNPQSLGLELSQPLYLGGQADAQRELNQQQLDARQQELRALEQQVLLTGLTAYLNLLNQHNLLQLEQANEQILQRHLQQTQLRLDAGDLTVADLAQAKARLARAVSERIAADGALNQAQRVFLRHFGDTPTQPLSPIELPAALPDSLAQAVRLADQHFSVKAAYFEQQAVKAAQELAASEGRAKLYLQAGLHHNDQDTGLPLADDSANIGLQLRLPLYQGGRVTAAVQEQRYRLEQAAFNRDDLLLAAQENASLQWEALQTATARLRQLQVQIDAAQVALDGISHQAEAGTRTLLDVLDFEQELLTARLGAQNASRDRILAAYSLKASIGELTPESLGLSR